MLKKIEIMLNDLYGNGYLENKEHYEQRYTRLQNMVEEMAREYTAKHDCRELDMEKCITIFVKSFFLLEEAFICLRNGSKTQDDLISAGWGRGTVDSASTIVEDVRAHMALRAQYAKEL